MSWINNGGWDYIAGPSRMIRTEGLTNSLVYGGLAKSFKSTKSYLYKTNIRNLSNYGNFTDYIIKKTPWNSSINYNYNFPMESYTGGDGYLYFYTYTNNNLDSPSYLNYGASESFNADFGILNVQIFELSWRINGYCWIGDGELNIEKVPSTRSNGWIYNSDDDSFNWYDTEPTITDETGQPIQYSLPNPPLFNPVGANGEVIGSSYSISGNGILISPFKKINHISRFIDYQFFNFRFNYEKIESSTDKEAGVSIYTSFVEPYIGTSYSQFDDYLSNSELIASITESGTYSFYGLTGKKYLLLVGDPATFTYSAYTEFKLSNLNVSGGYHPANNYIYNSTLDFQFNDDVLLGATYSIFSGSGNNIEDNIIGVTISSKIGNGKFKSGLWKNGVWNNGWRLDEGVFELYDVINSVKIISDVRWRVRISGLTSILDNFKIGDKVSIGNIIAIDINENRKLLKDYYTIMYKSILDDRLSYIDIIVETQFPIRRIEKDSENHRIKITKNVWLSGTFLNGYFTGIWNNGKFRGYPYITEMFDTNWIDGYFDGGHFKSSYYVQGRFTSTFKYAEKLPAKLGIIFDEFHNLKVGDIIKIDKDDKSINFRYDGEARVDIVIDDYIIVTNIDYGMLKNNESGNYTTNLRTGIIQNMIFDSQNVSQITSVDSMLASSVFIYNSWIDVIYDKDSAVNIGKPQNILNKISNKSYSENNLYGYPTNDVLSSKSKFRDSYSLDNKIYNLGNKYQIYNDYIGDSSKFTEYFGTTDSEINLLIDQGWTYSKSDISTITFSRTENLGNTNILGEELKVESYLDGGVLDISDPINIVNRSPGNIQKERYSIIEFDLIQLNAQSVVYQNIGTISDAYWRIIPSPGSKISPIYTDPKVQWEMDEDFAVALTNTDLYDLREEPMIHLDNLNIIRREIVEGSQSTPNIYEYEASYLPIHKNINHVRTPNRKKIEFFYNKKNLSMNFRGNGFFGKFKSEYIINNIKLYEIDMIPFFQYFNIDTVNNSIQVPLIGLSPYVKGDQTDFNFLDSSNNSFDSVIINSSNNTLNNLESTDNIINEEST